MADQNSLKFTLFVNPDDDDEFRDRLTRDLLSESQDWQSIEQAALASQPAKPGDRVAEAVIVGQLVMKVLPDLLLSTLNHVADWLKRGREREVELEIDGARAKFPADTSPEKLAAWVAALSEKQK